MKFETLTEYRVTFTCAQGGCKKTCQWEIRSTPEGRIAVAEAWLYNDMNPYGWVEGYCPDHVPEGDVPTTEVTT